MREILFLVEEAPEVGYTARVLGESIFTEADDLASFHQQMRNVSGLWLFKALGRLGYEITQQTDSHIRLQCHLPRKLHSLSIEDVIFKLFGND